MAYNAIFYKKNCLVNHGYNDVGIICIDRIILNWIARPRIQIIYIQAIKDKTKIVSCPRFWIRILGAANIYLNHEYALREAMHKL
ncbi:unnamed protein product [Parnassius mnemosyne]|uniref:Uncharacterized protein n=1 Tax=Parnassius mnemosyne TaxID=213953 RepID=A0AAV1M7N0_9NEOP